MKKRTIIYNSKIWRAKHSIIKSDEGSLYVSTGNLNRVFSEVRVLLRKVILKLHKPKLSNIN